MDGCIIFQHQTSALHNARLRIVVITQLRKLHLWKLHYRRSAVHLHLHDANATLGDVTGLNQVLLLSFEGGLLLGADLGGSLKSASSVAIALFSAIRGHSHGEQPTLISLEISKTWI